MLSIIIPCHNEEGNISKLVDKIRAVLKKNKIKGELLIINDRSTDKTGRIVDVLAGKYGNVRVIHRKPRPGPFKAEVGLAFIEAFRKARGNYIITMDGDLSHLPKDIPRFINAVKGSDVVIGSRYMRGGEIDSKFSRKLISRGFSVAARILYGLKIHDITSGYRIHRAMVLKRLDLKSIGFEIHAEIPLKAKVKGYRVSEIPIRYAKRLSGKSKLKYLKTGPKYISVMLRTRLGV